MQQTTDFLTPACPGRFFGAVLAKKPFLIRRAFEHFQPPIAPDELIGLLKPFAFIPDWRRADMMVRFAPAGGSVGPHTDGYDVFLLQVMGVAPVDL